MKLIIKSILFLIVLMTAAFGCVFYAFRIEPYMLKVHEYKMYENTDDAAGVKIVQISDLHIKEDFTHENLDRIVKKINEQKPGIVLFTGDLYDNYAKYNDDDQIILKLQQIEAAYAKIAVWGNRDYGGGAVRTYEMVMEQSGFTVLKNENRYITFDHGRTISVTGLDDSILGNPDMPGCENIDASDYSILLTHEPDAAENYPDHEYDLVISGHSHGGQIKIPFLSDSIKKAATTALAVTYRSGMYTLPENRAKLYVNTGIGTAHLSARFGVVPEITVFYI